MTNLFCYVHTEVILFKTDPNHQAKNILTVDWIPMTKIFYSRQKKFSGQYNPLNNFRNVDLLLQNSTRLLIVKPHISVIAKKNLKFAIGIPLC